MQPGRDYRKAITSVHGTNQTNSSTQAYRHVEVPQILTATPGNLQYQGEEDSVNVLSGAGGDGEAGSPEKAPYRWGHVTPSGSRIEVNDTAGAERVDIVHHTGAGIAIDPDGAIYVVSQSQRGAGVAAPFGDIYISAAGDVVIKGGASLSIETAGDLNVDVGGTFQVKCNDYNLQTKSYNATIDGAHVTNITNDSSTVIGGIERVTVAGDARKQVTGNAIADVGGNQTTRVGGSETHDIGSDHSITQGGKLNVSSGGDQTIATSGKSNITSSGDSTVYSGGDALFTASGSAHVKAGGNVKLTGSEVNSVPPIDLAKWADESQQAAQASVLAGSVGSRPSPNAASAGSAAEVASPKDAQVMEAADIVDTLTSARKYPEYPGNGVTESSSAAGLGMISHDTMPQAESVYNEYSGGNSGNLNPSQPGETYDHLPEQPVDRDPNITAVDPNKPIPAYNDLSAKISKYFTLGMIINGTTTRYRPSPNNWEKVVKQGILLANNVLDPIKEKFPDVKITSWYRTSSSNHVTGRAIDIVVESRSIAKHAEIARFARDNLPVDQVFLERNTSGRSHVHLRVSQGGGAPRVLSCGDPKCRSRVPGIDVAWLKRKGTQG